MGGKKAKHQKRNVYSSLMPVITLEVGEALAWILVVLRQEAHCIMHFHLVPCTDTAGDTSYQACQIQKKQFSKHCDQILMKFNSFLALQFLGDIIDKNSLCFPPCLGSLCSLAALSKCYGVFFSPQRWLVFTNEWKELCSLTAYSVNNPSCQDFWILQFSFQEIA